MFIEYLKLRLKEYCADEKTVLALRKAVGSKEDEQYLLEAVEGVNPAFWYHESRFLLIFIRRL